MNYPTASTRAKILLVEDHRGLRDLVAQVLELDDYTVITAQDGIEGIRVAQNCRPDLVVSDVNMPRMDGFQFLREFRALEGYADVPFVFVTGVPECHYTQQTWNVPGADFLSKPVSPTQLLGAVRERLARSPLSGASLSLPSAHAL